MVMLMLLSLGSCNSFLDIKPEGEFRMSSLKTCKDIGMRCTGFMRLWPKGSYSG